jgi:hypothetical protein
MNPKTTKLSFEEHISVMSALYLNITENWKYRKSKILRESIKKQVNLLRKIRSNTLFVTID